MAKTFVGIDVASDKLDVFTSEKNKFFTIKRSKDSINKLIKKLSQLNIELVAIEATGGYEAIVACSLSEANIPLSIVNPRKVRDFAKATGKLAKTDKIDAQVLAHFAEKIRPKQTKLMEPERLALRSLVRRRKTLVNMINLEKNRMSAEIHDVIKVSLKESIEYLTKSVKSIDKLIESELEGNAEYKSDAEILKSVPGVGQVLAQTLIAELPELGYIDRAAITSLVGLAPFNCDSGKMRGKRKIWGGRQSVRNTLYMSALVAATYNPVIKRYYNSLKDRGKPSKIALVACMRKLLLILNSMMKTKSFWQEF